jgi:NAD(P)H-hydrate repair Nnr-like enzyme with NAD(P)H-hydrate epimerase domain
MNDRPGAAWVTLKNRRDSMRAMRSLSRDHVRAVDRLAIEKYGLPGIVLVENAGRNAAVPLHGLAGRDGVAGPVGIVCGIVG